MKRALSIATDATFGLGVLWLLSEMIGEIHRLDESVADIRLRVGQLDSRIATSAETITGLNAAIERLSRSERSYHYWWLRQR